MGIISMDLLAAKPLELSNIRYALIRQEDTIIFKLIERAQFPLNSTIYKSGGVTIPEFEGSFLDFILWKSEQAHALVRRYQSPDEYAFSDDLPEPIIPPLEYPSLIKDDGVNVNTKIKAFYCSEILPQLCAANADLGEKKENYGSAAVCDVECLQALSRRIHFGKFVAEVKYLSDPTAYEKMIRARDVAGLEASITNSAVEAQVLARLERKAINYGKDPLDVEFNANSNTSNGLSNGVQKVDVKTVVQMYREFVIPLTKEVEIEYLLRRLDHT